MRSTTIKLIALCSVMALLAGCSFDQIAVLDHPARVDPGQQFEAVIYTHFLHINSSGSIQMDLVRDSLHFAVGAPAGWTAVSAKAHIAKGLNIFRLLSSVEDTLAFIQAVSDSAVLYKARATAMSADANFPGILSGRSYDAQDRNSENDMTVLTDSAGPWTAFRSQANILITQGTSVDTAVVDSSTGDTTGMTAVPIFIWVTMQARSGNGLDTLYYFAKTDAMPAKTDTNNIDKGDIAYVPIPVGNVSIFSGKTLLSTRQLNIRTRPGAGTVEIDLGALQRRTTGVEVYSLTGSIVADLSPMLRHSPGAISWQPRNSGVLPGMYVLRCKTNEGTMSQQFRIVR